MDQVDIRQNWYFTRATGETIGPVDLLNLRHAVHHKKLRPDDLVWHESLVEWKAIKDVAELYERPVTPPPISHSSVTSPPVHSMAKVQKLVKRDSSVFVVMAACAAAVLTFPVAVLYSQYAPIGGGFLAALGKPWSPARLAGISSHVVGFAIAGAIAGAGIAYLYQHSRQAAMIVLASVVALLVLPLSIGFLQAVFR